MSLRQLQNIGTDIWLAEGPTIAHGTWVRQGGAAALLEGFSWLGV